MQPHTAFDSPSATTKQPHCPGKRRTVSCATLSCTGSPPYAATAAPLIGIWLDYALHFCTGPEEQKAHNLEANADVAVATGKNTWAAGTDVVVEGRAARVTDNADLQRLADAYLDKYGEDWRFEVGDGIFGTPNDPGYVFRVDPTKVLTFAKQPHGQTSYRFGGT